MSAHRVASALALLTIVGTLAVLLFPVASGPYPATHGPVTSLRAMRLGLALLIALVQCATSSISITCQCLLLFFLFARSCVAPGHDAVSPSSPLVPASSVLRC